MIYVTHDLAVVAGFADRIAVMYAGRIVEQGPTGEILRRPKHPQHPRPPRFDPRPRSPPVPCANPRRSSGAWLPATGWRRWTEVLTAHRGRRCIDAGPRKVGVHHLSRCLRPEDVASSPQSPPASTAPSLRSAPLLTVSNLRAEYRGRVRWWWQRETSASPQTVVSVSLW